MRRRLRPMPDLAGLYVTPHDHTRWADHRVRVDVTSTLAHNMIAPGETVADLSCGDATVAKRLAASRNATLILGDYAPGYPITGPIESTVKDLDPVDLFLCCETIEHLDDPDAVLADIRPRTDRLILSTPEGEDNNSNPEHIWGWDCEAVEKMLRDAGFTPFMYNFLDLRPAGFVYAYQIWCCR